jgi:hypothetical protein
MANSKQAGSNVTNIEYSLGRCTTHCEQCFVNFGLYGSMKTRVLANQGWASALARAEGLAKKYPGTYKPPPKAERLDPAKVKTAADEEALQFRITEGSPWLYNFPSQSAWEPEYIAPYKARCATFDVIEGAEKLGPVPFFLRVSTMCDSANHPAEWLEKVKAAWGDYCFFNSCIYTLRRRKKSKNPERRRVLDVFHKLVVTTNPGNQRPPRFQPSEVRITDTKRQLREGEKWRRQTKLEGDPRGTMGKAGAEIDGDFFHPLTVTDIGLPELEKKIKFYRLRALPTILPRLETDRPVVITQMRFRGFDNMAEFARRYGLEMEIHTRRGPSTKKHPDGVMRKVDKLTRDNFGDLFTIIPHDEQGENEAWIRTPPAEGQRRNAHENAGDWSVYVYEDGWIRPQNLAQYNYADYVCDRIHGGCSHCGLCASLDGTGKTIQGVKFANPLNFIEREVDGKVKRRHLLPLTGIEGTGYLGVYTKDRARTKKKGPVKGPGFFAAKMQEMGWPVEVPTALRGWLKNPPEVPTIEEAQALVAEVAAYGRSGLIPGGEWLEDWNTYAHAEAAAALAYWAVLVHADDKHMNRKQAYDYADKILGAAQGEVDVLSGIEDLDLIWDGEGRWVDQFGPVR